MSEIIGSLNSAFTLAFVVTSMFGLGLGLTVQDLIAPLRNVRLVIAMLVVNFVLVPAVAWVLTRLLPLGPDLEIGLILMSTVAGAPLAIKASQIARGDVVAAGSLVTLQVVATVIYLPIVLPLLVPGIAVDAVAIALPLFLQILLPLGFGLFMNVRYDEEAEMTRPIMGDISNTSLARTRASTPTAEARMNIRAPNGPTPKTFMPSAESQVCSGGLPQDGTP